MGEHDEFWSVPNDPAGIATLLERLRSHTVACVIVEATGGLELLVVAELYAAKLDVIRNNFSELLP